VTDIAYRRRRRKRAPLPLAVAAGVGAVIAALPVVYLLDRARTRGLDEVRDEIFQWRTYDLVVRSSTLMMVVTLACTVLGVAAAFLVTRTDLPLRRLWQVVLALPLAIPTYVAAYAWVSARPSLAGFHGATLVLVLTSYPYVYLPAMAALTRLDPAQEEVARSLGLSPAGVTWRVTLRQIRPATTAGALLVALYVLSDFGAVGTMRYPVFTWVIYGAYNAGFNPARAAILSVVLLGMALVLVALEMASRSGATATRIGAGAARPPVPLPLGRMRPVATAFVVGLFALSIGFPAASITRWLQRSVGDDIDTSALAAAVWASLRVSLLAALVTTLLAIPIGVLAARYRTRASATLERMSYLAHALPGIVIAVSMVYVGVRLLRPIYQETPLLVMAYSVLFLPLAVGSVRTAVEQSSIRVEEVARSLGRRPVRAFFEVTARAAAPGVAAGAALVFLAGMKELPATLLLHPTGMQTLATGLWQRTGVSDYGGAAPYAAALVLFAALPTAVLGWWSGRLGDVASR
jgi:iron(III) transport system permease protein